MASLNIKHFPFIDANFNNFFSSSSSSSLSYVMISTSMLLTNGTIENNDHPKDFDGKEPSKTMIIRANENNDHPKYTISHLLKALAMNIPNIPNIPNKLYSGVVSECPHIVLPCHTIFSVTNYRTTRFGDRNAKINYPCKSDNDCLYKSYCSENKCSEEAYLFKDDPNEKMLLPNLEDPKLIYEYCTKEKIEKDTCSTPKLDTNTNKSKTIYMCTSSNCMTCKEDSECLLSSNCVNGICIQDSFASNPDKYIKLI
ncbi:hypothetical protein U3516DRAFT_755903 [Neocallimastix sp. 'constans']